MSHIAQSASECPAWPQKTGVPAQGRSEHRSADAPLQTHCRALFTHRWERTSTLTHTQTSKASPEEDRDSHLPGPSSCFAYPAARADCQAGWWPTGHPERQLLAHQPRSCSSGQKTNTRAKPPARAIATVVTCSSPQRVTAILTKTPKYQRATITAAPSPARPLPPFLSAFTKQLWAHSICSRSHALPRSTTQDKKPYLPSSFPVILISVFNITVSILPQLRFQQFFSQVRTNALPSLCSAVLVIAQQPQVKGSAKGTLIFSYPPLGLKGINVYAETCKESHCVCWIKRQGKGRH